MLRKLVDCGVIAAIKKGCIILIYNSFSQSFLLKEGCTCTITKTYGNSSNFNKENLIIKFKIGN